MFGMFNPGNQFGWWRRRLRASSPAPIPKFCTRPAALSPQLVDPATNKENVLAFQKEWGTTITLSQDGKVMATRQSGSDDKPTPGMVRLWDMRTDKEIRHWVANPISEERPPLMGKIHHTAPLASSRMVPFPEADNASVSLRWNNLSLVAGLPPAPRRTTRGGGESSHWVANPISEERPPGGKIHHTAPLASSRMVPFRGGQVGGNHRDQEGCVRIWETATGRPLLDLPGHKDVSFVAFSPDARRIVTRTEDKPLRLWEPTTGSLLEPPHCHCNPLFSNDGRLLFTGSEDGAVRVWEVLQAGSRTVSRHTPLLFTPWPWRLTAILFGDGGRRYHHPPLGPFRLWKGPPRPASPKELQAWWSILMSDDAKAAYEVMSRLTTYPKAVDFLKNHLRPDGDLASSRIVRLIEQVGDKKFTVREQASRELKELGSTVHPSSRRCGRTHRWK